MHSWLPFKEKFPHLFTAWAFCSNNSYSFLGFSSPICNLDNKQLTTGSCNSQVVCSEKSWLISVHSFAFLALKHASTNQNYPHKCTSYGQLHYLQLWKILLMGTPTSLGNFYPSGPPPPRNFHWPSRGWGVWIFSGFAHFDVMCDLLLNWCTTTWNQIDKTPEGIW